jgi:hypothetical protein
MSVEPVVNRLGWTPQDVDRANQNAQIIELLREIRDLLKPKPVGRPRKDVTVEEASDVLIKRYVK